VRAESELEHKPLRQRWWRSRRLCVLCVFVVSVAVAAWVRMGPIPEDLLAPEARTSTEIVDRRGQPLYEALAADGTRSRAIDPDDLPPALVAATIAVEDRRFYHHVGVDPLAMARAVGHALRAGRLVEGGSTLTQQAVKQLIRRPRTARGKLREMLLALRLEHRLSKREILALYLNVAPYGNQIVGAEAASRAYFGCAARDLTPAQAAFLAGLPQRPTAFNPYRGTGAWKRQQVVLDRMARQGALDPQALAVARAERLRIVRDSRAFLAPHFVERARAEAGGTPRRIETTLDADLQRRVRGIVDMHRERLLAHGAHNVAIAVLDNAGAEWLAWEGSGDYQDAEHGGAIDGVVAPRQPGSALKPFTYALAFERDFTPASVLPDLPAHFPTAKEGMVYSPRNYDGVFRGPLRARPALAGSENVPAVWLLSQVGVPDLLRLLRRGGFTTLDKTADHYGFALTMGDAEVRLRDVVAAYAALARGGEYRSPRLLRSVTSADGSVRPVDAGPAERLVSEESAFWVGDVLADPEARAYVFGRGGSLEFPFPVAVKTGTSQAYHDNWTVGFTKDVTVGVWVGNFDRTPLQSASGVVGAAPIFHDVLLAAQEAVQGRLPDHADETLPAPPPSLASTPVCLLSGLRAGPACPSVGPEWLRSDRLPARCTWHQGDAARSVVAWPSRYRSWARAQGLLDDQAPLPRPPAHGPREAARAALRIVNPPAGATYLRDPTLRAEYQTLPLRAEAVAAPLTWEVNGRRIGTTSGEQALPWPLAAGAHVIRVTDARGRRAEASILVK
jgi:penicillin-binding protein 1C